MMRTTLTLEDEIEALLRKEAHRTGKSFKQTVNDASREGLAKRRAIAKVPPFIVEARPMGTYPGLDYSNIGELLEIADDQDRR